MHYDGPMQIFTDKADEPLRKKVEVNGCSYTVSVTVNNNNDNIHDNSHYSDGDENVDD